MTVGTSLYGGATAAARASAMTALADDSNHNGNGSHNHNAFSIRSPTRNSGRQAVSNANAGGVTSTRNAFCKRNRHCVIYQREVVFLP